MQTLMTLITVMAGMAFSLAVAILVEEWIFGKCSACSFHSRRRGLSRVKSADGEKRKYVVQQ